MNNQLDAKELRSRVEARDEILSLVEHPGWARINNLLRDQALAYSIDNATNAKDWEDYLQKRGKIQAIELLMTDIEDYIRQGNDASEQLERLDN